MILHATTSYYCTALLWASSHHGLEAAAILVALLVATGVVLWLTDKAGRRHGADDNGDTATEPTDCGATAGNACSDSLCSAESVCPSHLLLEGTESGKGEIIYYDDEELDAFKGREPASYTPDEEERFRDVLYTLLPADLMGWMRSLKRRGIAMPQAIHDEFIMLYNEHTGAAQ